MNELDVRMFFQEKPGAYDLYEAFREKVLALYPETEIRVQKSQISFYNRHMFACVSMARVRKASELPPVYIVVTFGLGRPAESSRIAAKTRPYPGRWTHHAVVSRGEELDEELFAWIREAYAFAGRKR